MGQDERYITPPPQLNGEEGLVDLFCGDCSFEEEVGADDDDHKDNDCQNNVHIEMVINIII